MIEQIKQAVFAAENVLNWTPEQCGQMFYNVARLQTQYNEAATLWATANYPSTQAVTVAWITGKSAAEAGLLWLQEINLSIESLKAHERDIDKRLSESEGHKLLREALREWYAFDPSRMDVVSMRMQFMAKLTIEDSAKAQTDKGVALRDVGVAMDLIDEELKQFVKAFSDSGDVKSKPIGKCPKDKRARLYRLSEILSDLGNFSPLNSIEKRRIRKHLESCERNPSG